MKKSMYLSSWKIKQCDELCLPAGENTPAAVEEYPSPWTLSALSGIITAKAHYSSYLAEVKC